MMTCLVGGGKLGHVDDGGREVGGSIELHAMQRGVIRGQEPYNGEESYNVPLWVAIV